MRPERAAGEATGLLRLPAIATVPRAAGGDGHLLPRLSELTAQNQSIMCREVLWRSHPPAPPIQELLRPSLGTRSDVLEMLSSLVTTEPDATLNLVLCSQCLAHTSEGFRARLRGREPRSVRSGSVTSHVVSCSCTGESRA